MPYSSESDPKLPAHVKKLGATLRKQWVEVFNGSVKAGDSEGVAMRKANGVVKKDIEVLQGIFDEGEKCAGGYDAPMMGAQPIPVIEVEEQPRPLGGATSFDEVDQYLDARKVDDNVWDLRYRFDKLVENIWAADDEVMTIEQKAAAVTQAAQDLAERIAAGPPQGMRSLLDRAKSAIGLGSGNKASKKEGGVEYQASDYADVPDVAKPTTWKLRLAEDKSGGFTVVQVGRAITAMQPGGFRGNKVVLGTAKGAVASRISAAIGKISGATDAQKQSLRDRLAKVKEQESAFYVTKALDGELRWLAVHSNKFEDRTNEGFTEESLRQFEARCDSGDAEMPELRLWHIPGTKCGRADYVAVTDGFIISSGTFDPGMEHVAVALREMQDDLGVSHGFYYPLRAKDSDGFYHDFETFEISPLPWPHVANAWTEFGAGVSRAGHLKEGEVDAMSLTPAKAAFLDQTIGKEHREKVEQGLEALSKGLVEHGVSFKEIGLILREAGALEAAKHEGGGNGNGNGEDPEKKPAEGAGVGDDAAAGASNDEGGVGDPDPESDPEAAKRLAQIKAVLSETFTPVAERLGSIEVRLTALERSDDAKIADKAGPRLVAVRPSQSADTLAPDQEAAAKALAAQKEDGKDREPVNPALVYIQDAARLVGTQA